MPVGNMEEHKQRIVVETQGWLLSVKVLVGEIQDRDIVKMVPSQWRGRFQTWSCCGLTAGTIETWLADHAHWTSSSRTHRLRESGEAQLFKLAISSAQAETSVWRQKCWWAAWRHCR